MKATERTLVEQMQITEFDIANRKEMFLFKSADEALLKSAKTYFKDGFSYLVDEFYEAQTRIPEISLLIGDADTLSRLAQAQNRYVNDLFSGLYDIEYVNNRLRIGLVHKRIGVDPKLYLAAIQTLKLLIIENIKKLIPEDKVVGTISALEKLIMFDISLVFDTYIRSMVSEIEISKEKAEQYASALEDKVKQRTEKLELLSRTDALTGLLNRQHLDITLLKSLRAAQRRNEPIVITYIDIDDFKIVNDTQGHQQGDVILKLISDALTDVSRAEDYVFRVGGDEFCIIKPNCDLNAAKNHWLPRLLEHIASKEGAPHISVGFAQTGPNDYLSAEELMQRADEAMYKEKQRMKKNSPTKE